MKNMNNRIFRSLAVLCLMLVSFAAAAQQKTTVKGTVRDSKGEPVIGAVVMLEGNSSVGVVTDANGQYTINIPAGSAAAKLNFSCISYVAQTLTVGKNSVIDVVLEDDAEQLEEVVVVGYGSMRKSDLTGSVASVKIDEDEAAKSTSLDQMIMGHAAGVDVMPSSESPDAGVSIRIRGITSLNGSSEPLYVVDGVILTSAETGTIGTDENEDVNSLMGINPQDIASLEILKDASATAIYGAAGANGVVLITTKQANREKPTIQFNAGIDIATNYRTIDVMDINQFEQFAWARKAAGDDKAYPNVILRKIYQDMSDTSKGLNPTLRVHNWQEEYLKPVPRQRYYLSISGRPKELAYTLSVGYNKTTGIVPNTSTEQFTARMNLDKKLFKKLSIGTKINFAFIHSRTMQGAGSSSNGVNNSFTKSLVSYRPFININDTQLDDEEEEEDSDVTKGSPSRWITDTYQKRDEYRITPSVYAEYAFFPWLKLRSAFGGDYHLQERTTYKSDRITKANPAGGLSYGERYNWNWDNTLTFNKKMKKHSVNATLGYTMSKNHNNTQTVDSKLIKQDGIGVFNIDSSFDGSLTFGETESSKMSFFGRAMYNYDDRYVLTATYRIDGSSLFAQGNRFGRFPSFAFAWRINQEPWFNVPSISTAKLRVGWGLVGNCSVSPYQVMTTYGRGHVGYHFNDGLIKSAYLPGSFSNSSLSWESTRQWNAGIDYAMWKGRLSLSIDAYYKNTDGLLQKRKLPTTSGYKEMWVNQGSIENKGIELTLEATPVIAGDFEWNISGNFSLNRNRLTDIGFDVEKKGFCFEQGVITDEYFYTGQSIGSSSYLGAAPINVYMLGQPIGLLYGYRTDGLVKEGEFGVPASQSAAEAGMYQQPGMINYVDMNGNGYIDPDDRTVIGDSNPDFTYGFNTSFTYKKLRLNLIFQGVQGRDIYNGNKMQLMDSHLDGNLHNHHPEILTNAWTAVNPETPYVIFQEGPAYGYAFYDVFTAQTKSEVSKATDRDVEDASYLRLATVSLNYTFDLPKNSPLRRIGVGASVNNLVTWTRYSGFSPIVDSYKITSQRIGIDSGGSPASRTFCFDLKFTF